MKKNYQKNATSATTPVLPEAVSVAMAELAADVQEGLLAMAVGAGLQVMGLIELEGEVHPQQAVTRRCDRVQAKRTRRRWLSRLRKP